MPKTKTIAIVSLILIIVTLGICLFAIKPVATSITSSNFKDYFSTSVLATVESYNGTKLKYDIRLKGEWTFDKSKSDESISVVLFIKYYDKTGDTPLRTDEYELTLLQKEKYAVSGVFDKVIPYNTDSITVTYRPESNNLRFKRK